LTHKVIKTTDVIPEVSQTPHVHDVITKSNVRKRVI